ncbi:Copper-containing nitrite reductase, partial [hydrothermal vent metagenome]
MTENNNNTPTNLDRRNFMTAAALGTAATVAVSGLAISQAEASPAMIPAEPLGVSTDEINISSLPRVKQTLVAPPFLPKHDQIAKGGPKIVEVEMLIEEKLVKIDDDGATIWAFTYNGTVPGPMIVCHQGDYIELTMKSASDNMYEHNVDFHASTGSLGGGGLTHIQPGEKVVLRFRAIKAGTFVYHCAPGGDMIPYHVVHGMNGAIMVLPRDGLKDPSGNPIVYDKAFYVGEQDYYIPRDENGDYKSYETAVDDYSDSLDVMRKLIPTHEVFNGSVGALAGDNAMTAKVGETVLIIHSQANRDTRPHLIGGHGDYVWETGSFNDAPATDLETWFIRGGSAGAAVYTFRQPGLYVYLNHNLIEAVMLGAAAHFKVAGDWN